MVHRGKALDDGEKIMNPLFALAPEDILEAQGHKAYIKKKFTWICDNCGNEFRYRIQAEKCEIQDRKDAEVMDWFINGGMAFEPLDNSNNQFTDRSAEARDFNLVVFTNHIVKRITSLKTWDSKLVDGMDKVPYCLGVYYENDARIAYMKLLLVKVKDVKDWKELGLTIQTMPNILDFLDAGYRTERWS